MRRAFLFLLLPACVEPGHFRVSMPFADEPSPDEFPLYAFVRIEERPADPTISENRILGTAGPAPMDAGGVNLNIPNIVDGEHRVGIAELRQFPSIEAPVRYYGISKPFSTGPGKDEAIEIILHLTRTPRSSEVGGLRVETRRGLGFVRDAEVLLSLITDRAATAHVSNVRTFPDDVSARIQLVETATSIALPPGFASYRLPWNLDRGLSECAAGTECPREVFGRAIDPFGYASITLAAPVILDRRPPSLRAETELEPSSAGPATPVKLTLIAAEVLARAPVITSPDSDLIAFDRLLPEQDEPSSTYVYLLRPFADRRPADGSYRLSAVLEDLAGNEADVEVDTLVLDGLQPRIGDLVVVPDRIGPSGTVTIGFRLGEDVSDSDLRVTLGGSRVTDCAREGEEPEIRVWCRYEMTGSEIAAGTQAVLSVLVTALDAALNRTTIEETIVVDFEPPSLLDATFAPDVATAGDTVLLRLLASEPLSIDRAPELHFAGPAPAFAHRSAASPSFDQYFVLDIDDPSPSGEHELVAVTIEDTLGNGGRVEIDPATLVIDKLEPQIGNVSVDVGAAAFQLPETSPPRINAAPGRRVLIQFSATDEHLDPQATRIFIGALDVSPICSSSGSGATMQWTCTYAMTGNETPGFQAIDIRAADLAGNRAGDATTAVIFDFDPPEVVAGSPAVTLVPDPANPLRTVTQVRQGTTVELRFELNEEPAEAPTVTAGTTTNPGMFTFTHEPRAGSTFLYTHTLGSTNQQGARSFTVTARDLAGNTSMPTTISGASFTVDTIAPRALAVDTADLIVLERRPWGDATSAAQRLTLSGGISAAEANATIVVSSPYGSTPEIGRIQATANGRIPVTDLNFADTPTLRLEAVDAAGNVGAPVTVRDGLWIASPRATIPNPNLLRVSIEAQETLDQSPYVGLEHDADATEIAAASLGDGVVVDVSAVPAWRRLDPGVVQPVARRGHGLAYDTRRGRAVLFGGNDGSSDLDDTWEHDGVGWNLISPAGGQRPSARRNPLVVYDARRECTLLVGGENASGLLNDVWCFDGSAWTEIAANAPFAARSDASIGYHEELGVVVLYGGRVANAALDDTWTWDGNTWTQMPGAGAPPARSGASMAYFPETPFTGRLILYGGRSGTSLIDETWSWSNGWRQEQPTTRPPPLGHVGLATDAIGEGLPRTMLFGGISATGPSSAVWAWNGTRWISWSPLPSTPIPTARIVPLVHDARNDLFLTFGGESPRSVQPPIIYGDTWARSSSRWTELTIGTDRPSPRDRVAVSSNSSGTAMFGGDLGDDRAWYLRGSTWDRHALAGPTARLGAAFAGLSGGAFAMFGGLETDQAPLIRAADTWLWTSPLASPPGGWLRVYPTNSPSPRDGHTMVRITNNRALLFGGETNNGFSDQTWIWDSNSFTWTLRAPCASRPSARTDHAMVYDPRRNRVVMFGGRDGPNTQLGDLWEWSVASNTCWTNIAPSGVWPSARRRAVLLDDPDRGRLVLFGGEDYDPLRPVEERTRYLDDTWVLTDASQPWLELTSFPTSIGPRSGLGGAYDPARGQIVVFGGGYRAASNDETWLLARGEAHRPSVRFTVAWDFAAVDVDDVEEMTFVAHAGARGYSPSQGTQQPGAALLGWDATSGRWWTMRSNTAGPGAPGLLSFDVPRDFAVRHITASGTIDVMVTSANFDYGAERARVALDDIEVRVRYRF